MLTVAVRVWMESGIVKLLLDAGLDPKELPSLQEKQKEENQPEKIDESVQDDGEAEQGYTEETNVGGLRCALHEATRPATRQCLHLTSSCSNRL
jgi:hypothetical protein